MAANDSALQNGTEKLSTNALNTVNGTTVTADLIEVQRMKMGFGTDGALRDVSAQFPMPIDIDSKRNVTFKGRASSFRTPGRAGTVGQKLFVIHNPTASPILVDIEKISIDTVATVIKAVTVLPAAIRLYRITAAPTGGTAVVKVTRDTAQTSSATLTVLADASADGTLSATPLAATLLAGPFAQIFAPRLITAAGYEVIDRIEFLNDDDEKITLRPLEGIAVMLDYVLATQNPATDMWLVNCKWTEYTAA